MLTLKDGRTELWQWDTGRELKVEGECSQVHFSNKIQGRSIDVDVVDGVAKIPDVLLQTDGTLNAWAFVGTAENGYTKVSKSFIVNKRNRPADYVFTPTDQTSVKELNDRLEKLEASQDPEAVGNAVKEYLENNPIKEEDPTVPQWAKEEEKPTYTADEVGALPKTTKIPSKTSELTNDSGYLTSVPSEYVTETELTAKGYAKQTDVDNLSKDLSGYALKEEIPIHLPNPQKLTFTGAVQGEYDGSNPLSVEIPSGGSGGSSSYYEEHTIQEDVTMYIIPFDLKKYRRFTINIYQPIDPQSNIEIGLCIDKMYNSVKDVAGSTNAYFSLELFNAYGLFNNGKYAIVGYSRRNNNSAANTNYFEYLQYIHNKIDGLHLQTSGTEVIATGTKIEVRAWE